MVEIDEFDKKILKIVQQNNRTPSEKISAEIGLSTSAVQRRLQRLRKTGVIQADVSIISPLAAAPKIRTIIGITLERENAAVLNDFKEKISSAAEVVQCYFVTGEVDFVIIAAFQDMSDFEVFARKFLTENPNVKRYVTNIVINEVKS